MDESAPRVSVGLPVYNGQAYLRDTIESLLRQSFGSFELIISDNASTDRTEPICREFAARDPRVRYVRSRRNVGVYNNFNRALAMARGQYYRWAGADDICEPDLLAASVRLLDEDPRMELVVPRGTLIDGQGAPCERDPLCFGRPWASVPEERGRALLEMIFGAYCMHIVFMMHGLMRTRTLRELGGAPNYPRGDQVLALAMSLRGSVTETAADVLRFRVHDQSHTATSLLDGNARNVWESFYPGDKPPRLLRAWTQRRHAGFVQAIFDSPLLTTQEKLRLAMESVSGSLRSFWWRGSYAARRRLRGRHDLPVRETAASHAGK